jgi:hypothetical protein
LIFRGLRLRAFYFFVFIKSGLKKHNFASRYLKTQKIEVPSALTDKQIERQESVFSKIMAFENYLVFNDEILYDSKSLDEKAIFSLKECSFNFIWIYLYFSFIKRFFFSIFDFYFFKLKFFFSKFNFFFDVNFFFLGF